MGIAVRAGLWFGFYLLLIVFPLIVGVVWQANAAGRPFLLQFGVACGFVAFAAMACEFALVSKVHSVSRAFGQDALLHFHRQMGIVSSVLVLVHAALMFHAGYPIAWLNPFAEGNNWAMRWGVLSAAALLALLVLSVGRQRLRLSYEWWHLTHAPLAEAAILFSLAHLVLFAGFSASAPMRILLGFYGALMLALRLWFVLLKPLRMWSRPWIVAENIPELGDSRTLVLEPAGHPGMTFEPGQFAWLITGRTPFQKDQHPISMSSCAYDEPGRRISFTIKNLGDWSGQVVPSIKPGDRIWVDGPYGAFTADREQGFGYVLIGGGAGIAPLFSMLQTFAHRGDARPVVLFYGGRDPASLTFHTQIEELKSRMNLSVVYSLKYPPEGWTGERGYLTAATLRKYLPAQFKRFQYFVCGPIPLMDAMETALREIGVPAGQIHTERFDVV
jgi:predicted ferric reductase